MQKTTTADATPGGRRSPRIVQTDNERCLLPSVLKRRMILAKGKYQEWLEEDKLLLLQGWARDGLTEQQIAKNVGISDSTLREWKKRFPTISAAIKKGKEVVDIIVENALFKKATGYNATVKKAFKVKRVSYDERNRRIEKEEIVIAEEEVHIPPDTTAQIFWLKNRRPDKWRDKPKEDDSTNDKIIENMQTLTEMLNAAPNRNIEDFENEHPGEV